MLKRFTITLLILIPFLSVAQTTKTYLTLNGVPTSNTSIASSYVIVQKLDADSAYIAKQYSMHDTLMSVGYYKDDHLTVPNGKFTYYSKMRVSINGKDSIINFVRQTGFYSNGQKTGQWVNYASKGVKVSVSTYEYDHLNGAYTNYDLTKGGWTTGNMINDKNVGSSYMFNADSLIIREIQFKDGVFVNSIEHLQDAEPKYDFYSYLEKKLKPYKAILLTSAPLVRYTITKDGAIVDPVVINGINHEIDSALVAALKTAPLFSPAKYNKVATTIKTGRVIYLYHHTNIASHPYHDSFKFVPVQRIQPNTYSAMAPNSDGSYTILIPSK